MFVYVHQYYQMIASPFVAGSISSPGGLSTGIATSWSCSCIIRILEEERRVQVGTCACQHLTSSFEHWSRGKMVSVNCFRFAPFLHSQQDTLITYFGKEKPDVKNKYWFTGPFSPLLTSSAMVLVKFTVQRAATCATLLPVTFPLGNQ